MSLDSPRQKSRWEYMKCCIAPRFLPEADAVNHKASLARTARNSTNPRRSGFQTSRGPSSSMRIAPRVVPRPSASSQEGQSEGGWESRLRIHPSRNAIIIHED
jgi:hypothetical protein